MPKYKKRADGRYSTHIIIGVKPDGKPLRKTIYSKTQRGLEEKAAELRRQVGVGTVVQDEGATVGEWAYKWLKAYKSGVGDRTYNIYEIIIRVHIIPVIGHLKLKDVRPFHIQGVINKIVEKDLTRVVVQTSQALKQIFKRAVDNNLLTKNPTELIEIPKNQKPIKRALTDQERMCFESADLDAKSRTFLFTLLYAGLRRGEALALLWKDISFEDKTISVSKTWAVKGSRAWIKPNPKTESGNRVIPIPEKLLEELKGLRIISKSDYVFVSARNEMMSESAFRRFWEKIEKQLNLSIGGDAKNHLLPKDITPHIFRHTYATMLFYAGVDIKAAQYLLGHSSVAMTMEVYACVK